MHNVPRMRRIHTQITRHPETHDQAAFWWLNLDLDLITRNIGGWAIEDSGEYCYPNPTGGLAAMKVFRLEAGARPAYVSAYVAARDLLGITDDEAEFLFYAADEKAAVDWLEDVLAAHDTAVLDALDYPFGEVTA